MSYPPDRKQFRFDRHGRKTYLFAFLDDRSRAVMAARFGFSEDTVRLAAALRPALASRGVPEHVYVDNGSAFVDSWLLRALHSPSRRPERSLALAP